MTEKKRIIIIEDNEMNMELLRDLLVHAGYDILTARDGLEGVKIARKTKPNLILMDVALPGMSGIDATDILKNDPETGDIPILAVTSSVMENQKQEIYEHGFDGLIPKPINTREILKAIKKYIK